MPNLCGNCGAALSGSNFCGGCGAPVSGAAPMASFPAPTMTAAAVESTVWSGGPDPVLSPIDAKTTTYELTTQRLIIRKGLVGKSTDSIELFRVKDIQVHRSLTQRARGRGDVWVVSVDPIQPVFKLESIAEPEEIAAKIRSLVMTSRAANRTLSIEGM